MALPDGATTITVTDNRTHPDGGPMRGRIILRPAPNVVTNPSSGHIAQGDAEARWIDGALSVTVLAADAAGYTPTGYTHTVYEYPDDAAVRSYPVLLTTALGASVDLAALAPVATYNGDYVLVPGPPGDDGTDGAAGASAYQLAVTGGFVGTEAQWIASLKGVKGDTGAQGPAGTPPTGDQTGVTRTAYKPTDEAVTASIALQADDHLTLTVTAGAAYALDACLVATGDPAGDLALTVTAPPGSTGGWTPTATTLGTTDGTGSVRLTRFDFGASSSMGVTAAGVIVNPQGGLIAGATGTVTIQWAQAVSSATPTTIKAASWIRLTRMS